MYFKEKMTSRALNTSGTQSLTSYSDDLYGNIITVRRLAELCSICKSSVLQGTKERASLLERI